MPIDNAPMVLNLSGDVVCRVIPASCTPERYAPTILFQNFKSDVVDLPRLRCVFRVFQVLGVFVDIAEILVARSLPGEHAIFLGYIRE